ncbi:MAG: TauD/TfdA family dioxygenase [Williamsia sp.]|nr:TauD/TfdA family dioxygenase [Williamsia sp.]
MDHTALNPVGARVTGIRVEALTDAQTDLLRNLLAHHGVIILPDQHIDDDQFRLFLRSFGETVFTEGETPVPGHPDLNVISNVGRTTPPRSQFHVDTSYVRHPPAYTALRAVDVPEQGGQTLFSNQFRAFETLPADVRENLLHRTVTHVMTGLDLDDEAETSAEHPLCRVHPISKRTALYLSTPQRCAAVSGLSPEEAEYTVASLLEHSTREENVLRHNWSPGDVVMWDNRAVMHRADHSGVVGDRVMHRGMVAEPAV